MLTAALPVSAGRAAATDAIGAKAAQSERRPDGERASRGRQAVLPAPIKPALSQLAGRLTLPAAGATLHAFGSAFGDGPASGVIYAAAPGGFVVSPCSGRIAFAAPFRSYGKLIIVECGGGRDVVLAGLGTLSVSPGLAVRSGEQLGRMPHGSGSTDHSDRQGEGLYVELRIHGRPVNPAPFFARPS